MSYLDMGSFTSPVLAAVPSETVAPAATEVSPELAMQRESLRLQRESVRLQKSAIAWQLIGVGFSAVFLYLWTR